jgi:hypothetical protein
LHIRSIVSAALVVLAATTIAVAVPGAAQATATGQTVVVVASADGRFDYRIDGATGRASLAVLPQCNGNRRFIDRANGWYFTLPTVLGDATANQVRCVMGLGSTGVGVFTLQLSVNARGSRCHNAGLVPDSIYGEKTRNVILWGQAAAGFPPEDVDGVYGPQTQREALRWPVFRLSNDSLVGCTRIHID